MARKSKIPTDMSALLVSSSGTLAQIQEKTKYLTTLSNIVRQICPDLPEDAWHIANFKQNTLIIEVKSSVWGQRLQFERTKIAEQLAQETQGQFTMIQLKVNPLYHHQKKPSTPIATHSMSVISKNTAKHLEDLAENAPKGLKEKLLKLAKHGK